MTVLTVNELPAVIHCKTGNKPGLFGIIALVVVVINGPKLMTSYVFLDRVKAVEGVIGVAYVSAVARVAAGCSADEIVLMVPG